MKKIKHATIVAIIAISGVIGFMSMRSNKPKPQLSEEGLVNVEALTQTESSVSSKELEGDYKYSKIENKLICCIPGKRCRL